MAHKLWGGADGLSLERQRRNKLRDAAKQKQFTKKITGCYNNLYIVCLHFSALQNFVSKSSTQFLNPASLMLLMYTNFQLQERKVVKCTTLILTLGQRHVQNVDIPLRLKKCEMM